MTKLALNKLTVAYIAQFFSGCFGKKKEGEEEPAADSSNSF